MAGYPDNPTGRQPGKIAKLLAATLVLAAAGLALNGCGQETRHEILTFFFTGVPPLDAEAGPGEAGLSPAELARRRRAETAARYQEARLRAQKWTHGPYGAAECQRCHAFGGSLGFRSGAQKTTVAVTTSAPRRLLMPVEEICFTCHTTKSAEIADQLGLRLHGPVASGLCVGCHSPHQSQRRYMLRGETNQELCTNCHEIAGIRQRSPLHAAKRNDDCLACHNPHMGKSALNLRSDYDESTGH